MPRSPVVSIRFVARLAMWLGVVLGAGLTTTACSSEIGDECAINADCSNDGSRTCDQASEGGYCTVVGCDFDTCPEEAVCVRFYVGGASNRTCAPATEDLPSGGTDECSLDEACSLRGVCVPRSSEVRYCMRTCGECRDGYECRDGELMRDHGGEPVPPPGERLGDNPQAFCAQAPSAATTETLVASPWLSLIGPSSSLPAELSSSSLE